MKKLLIIIGVTIGLNTNIGSGPIHDAAWAKNLDEIKSLIEIGVSFDHRDKNGWTALMISIAQNDFETADYLISIGADVNAKTKRVQDAYGGPNFLAVTGVGEEFLNLLLANGVDINQHRVGDWFTPLMLARFHADKLIENGADVNVRDNLGRTVLHHFMLGNSDKIDLLKLIFSKNADVNATDYLDRTPLDFAKYIVWSSPRAETLELFVQAGAKTGLALLQEKVAQLSIGTTNPTDEWTRKMWEIDLGFAISDVRHPVQGAGNAIMLEVNTRSILTENKNFGFSVMGLIIN